MPEVRISTHKKSELIDITGHVRRVVSESRTLEGTCHLFVPHTTAGIIVNENSDPTVKEDILFALERIVPSGPYSHLEGNSGAHIKAALLGSEVTLMVEHGQPHLGRWQGVFLAEFDGPRTRRVVIQVAGRQQAGGRNL